jgi:hypothetical protein
MPVNIWATVGAVPGFIPVTALTGAAGQLFGMNAGATAAEWKTATYLNSQLALPVGSAAAPAYTFTGSLNSGWYEDNILNAMCLSISGARRFRASDLLAAFQVPLAMESKLMMEDKSVDIVAAANIDFGTATGNYVYVTNAAGAINLADLGGAALPAGTEIEAKFIITGGSITLVHNINNLNIPGAANLALITGDYLRFRKTNDASAFWEVVSFQRGLSSTQFTAKGDLLVGKLSGGIIIPGVQAVGSAGSVLMSDPTLDDSIFWDTGFSRKNAVINGEFNVWQRGVTFVAPIGGTYCADRFFYTKVGVMVHDVSRSTDVPTVAQAGRLFNYSMLVDCTTVDAAIAAGDLCYIVQPIEGYNWLPLAQIPTVLSFWVKATKTGIYCASLRNSATDRSCVAEFTVLASDVWEKKTVTFPASPSAGTWDYTTGIGAYLVIALAAGATFQTAAGVWQVGNFTATANQVNGCDNVANNFKITGIQLEAGTVATPFENRPLTEELLLCQRYYFKTFSLDIAPVQNAGVSGGLVATFTSLAANVNMCGRSLPVEMRAVPTVVTYNNHAANANFSQAFGGGQEVAPNVFQTTKHITMSNVNAGTLVVPNPYEIHFTASAEL